MPVVFKTAPRPRRTTTSPTFRAKGLRGQSAGSGEGPAEASPAPVATVTATSGPTGVKRKKTTTLTMIKKLSERLTSDEQPPVQEPSAQPVKHRPGIQEGALRP